MTPEEREQLARVRYGIITILRASGAVLMLIGLWIWLGDILREGGWPAVGLPLFIAGFFESLVVPQILARQWRTPPGR